MALDDLYNKIVAIQEFDVAKETIDIINEHSEIIKTLLRNQLSLGKDGKKQPVTIFNRPYYAIETIYRKSFVDGLGGQTDRITNYMQGYFYMFMDVVTKGNTFETISDVDYFDEIIARSGSVIMELDKDSLSFFSETVLKPLLIQRFNARFNGI